MNVFQSSYTDRLRSWSELRNSISKNNIEQAAIETDNWWQQAPQIKQHLHWNDTENWPSPWDILSENTYCPLTRAVGMCYTLLMQDISVELLQATDAQCEDHYLVSVDNAKYLLNYWPNSVLNISLSDFTIQRSIPVDVLKQKLK